MEKIETKICSKCNNQKPIEDFGKYKQCSKCVEYCKEYNRKNAEKRSAYAKDYIEKTKEDRQTKVFCNDCNVEVQKCNFEKHFKSKTHLWNTGQDAKKEFDDKSKYTKCEVCNWSVQTKSYKRHLQTPTHLENLNKKQQ